MKYRVDLTSNIDYTITVDVPDDLDEDAAREAAIEKAFDVAPSSLCVQCSGWRQDWSLDLPGDWDVAKDHKGNESVEKVED